MVIMGLMVRKGEKKGGEIREKERGEEERSKRKREEGVNGRESERKAQERRKEDGSEKESEEQRSQKSAEERKTKKDGQRKRQRKRDKRKKQKWKQTHTWLAVVFVSYLRGNGHHHDLARAQPKRPLASKVLTQNGKHALNRTENGAVDNHRAALDKKKSAWTTQT